MTTDLVEKPMEYLMESGEKMKLTIAMVRNYLVQGRKELVSDQEIMYFMHECKARKLNPFLRECWLIKYSASSPAQILESIHHKRAKARNQPDCQGWEKGLILENDQGSLKYTTGLVREGEKLLGAYFKATPKGWTVPYELEINLSGYIKKKSNGEITKFWQEENQPSQIMKVVESQGLSALWGGTIGTNMIPEELPIDLEPDADGTYESVKEKTETRIKEFKKKINADLEKKGEENKIKKDLSNVIDTLAAGALEEKEEPIDPPGPLIHDPVLSPGNYPKLDPMSGAADELDRRLGGNQDKKVPCKFGCGTMVKEGATRHENSCEKNPKNPNYIDTRIPQTDQDPPLGTALAQEKADVIENLKSNFPNIDPVLFGSHVFKNLQNLLISEKALIAWKKGWGQKPIVDEATLNKATTLTMKEASRETLGNHEGHETGGEK